MAINVEVQGQSYISNEGSFSQFSVTAGYGSTLFFGDMKQYRFYPVVRNESEWSFGGSLVTSWRFSRYIGLRAHVLKSALAGTRREWNRYFQADLWELGLGSNLYITDLLQIQPFGNRLKVFFTGGAGWLYYNTTVYDLQTGEIAGQLGFGSGSGIQGRTSEVMLFGGFGAFFELDESWGIHFETANRILNSDELDKHIGGTSYDIYNYTFIGVFYTIGNTSFQSKEQKRRKKNPVIWLPPGTREQQRIIKF